MGTKTVSEFTNPGIPAPASDALPMCCGKGARCMPREAVEAEVQEVLTRYASLKDGSNHQRWCGNGRERSGSPPNSLLSILRQIYSLAELLPWLYLRGISPGDLDSVLTSLLEQDVPGLSATTTQRLKQSRKEDHRQRVTWDLSRTYVYLWAEGIHFNVRMGNATHCVLVVIGATTDKKKERLAIQDDRESEQSWKELLLDLKRQGPPVDTKRAIGDGVLEVWKALSQVVGDTLEQRCGPTRWPTSPRPRASSTRSGWRARNTQRTRPSMALSPPTPPSIRRRWPPGNGSGRPPAFYDFPAEHWGHIRTDQSHRIDLCHCPVLTVKTGGRVSQRAYCRWSSNSRSRRNNAGDA